MLHSTWFVLTISFIVSKKLFLTKMFTTIPYRCFYEKNDTTGYDNREINYYEGNIDDIATYIRHYNILKILQNNKISELIKIQLLNNNYINIGNISKNILDNTDFEESNFL